MVYELEDSKTTIKPSLLSEVYYKMKKHEILASEVDYDIIENFFMQKEDLKPKEIFDILEITENPHLINHVFSIIGKNHIKFLPEEWIILLNLSD